MARQPLSDVTVLELSTMIAGPYAGQMLGDLGADVVKIERPEEGELARSLEPSVGSASFYYLTANRNKRSLALDITTEQGQEVFLGLASRADIVLENFQPEFTDRYGIDYESVKAVNEDVVYCSVSAFGETGPYRTEPGIDTTVQALNGAMSMTKTEGSPPLRSGIPMNDVFAAQYAVQGILTALFDRVTGGGGEFIDVSLLDAGVAGLSTRGMYSLVTGDAYPPFGRRHNYFAPEGRYEAVDGDVQLSVVTDRHWQRFCEAIDAPELAADERFETVAGRVAERDVLDTALAAELDNWTVSELVTVLRDAGIPAAPIEDTLSVWEHPQVQAREMLRELDHPDAGSIETIGFPVKYSGEKQQMERHPPRLGEHSEAVLEQLGYDADEIESLSEAGVVGIHADDK